MGQNILGQTSIYQEAVRSLQSLKADLGLTPELRAIARLLLVCHDAVPASERVFCYVGDLGDERDRAVVRAFKSELERLIVADDGDGEFSSF